MTYFHHILVTLFLSKSFVCNFEGDSPAILLASKNIINDLVAQNKDMTVLYTFHNVGSKDATEITVHEESFQEPDFELKFGVESFEIPRLRKSQSFTHAIVYTVKAKEGRLGPPATSFTYFNGEETVTALTSKPQERIIVSENYFMHKLNNHLAEWFIYGILALVFLFIIPLYSYYSRAKRNYAHFSKKAK